MNTAFELLSLLLAAVVLLPVLLLLLQVLAAWPAQRTETTPDIARPRLAILVPAHNESGGILDTLKSLLPQLQPGDRLVVVADNCSDDTAQVASSAGADVVERTNLTQRGKGYALDFGVRHLEADPPELVLIVDADCLVQPGAINRIARNCAASARPVQALYLMKTPPAAGPMAPIAEFAWVVKNLVRPLGYHRMGQPCQLMGTGMGFPWKAFGQVSLASGHIVEDMKMGIELADAGFAPLFCPDALVTSVFPQSKEGSKSQRTRWEHGHLGMIVAEGPRYFLRALRTGNLQLLALVLDMCVPPLALLTMGVVLATFVGLLCFVLGGGLGVLLFALLPPLCLVTAIMLAWARFGRSVVSFGRLAYAPLYALKKIPLYMKFLLSRQVDWVRSKRDQR